MAVSSKSAGWFPTFKSPPWLFGVSAMCLGLGAVSATMWSDLVGLSQSPMCGPSCLDAPIQKALLANDEKSFQYYRVARQSAMAQLAYSPFDAAAWLRIVLLEMHVADGRLTPSALDALRQSYVRAPVDATVAEWRIPLAFETWGQLSPDVRKAAVAEVRVLFGPTQNRPRLLRLSRQIRSSEGGFAYWLLLESLEEEAARPVGRETPTPMPSASAQKPAIAGT